MYTRFTLIYRFLAVLVILSFLFVTHSEALAVINVAPPPLGPPQPSEPIKELPVDVLTTVLKDKLQETVDDVNANIETNADQNGVRAKISWRFLWRSGPWKQATQYPNLPNEFFINIPHKIDYRVYNIEKRVAGAWVSVGLERHLYQTLELQVFCDKWETGHGELKIVAQPHPLNLAEPGSVEKVIDFFVAGQLTRYIDNQLRKRLPNIPAVTSGWPVTCNTLGRITNLQSERDEYITWSYNKPLTVPLPTADRISVRLTGVKRLPARNLYTGDVLYAAKEAPHVEFYANHRFAGLQLPAMQEGQQLSLDGPVVTVAQPSSTGLLVVIANLRPDGANLQVEENAFRAFDASTQFGRGVQKLVIRKSYWRQPDPFDPFDLTGPFLPRTGGGKPYKVFVDAYELTFQVNYFGNSISQRR